MTFSKPYSSKEIAQVVERWRPCKFFVMNTNKPIITLSHYELYAPHSWARCTAAAIEKIKAALLQAYNEGIREVGLLCGPPVQEQLINAALSVTPDVTWKIYPHSELTYHKYLFEIKQKIWNEAVTLAKVETSTKEMEAEVAEAYGFTAEVFAELDKYAHVENAQELPEHLRKLFRDGQPEEKNE